MTRPPLTKEFKEFREKKTILHSAFCILHFAFYPNDSNAPNDSNNNIETHFTYHTFINHILISNNYEKTFLRNGGTCGNGCYIVRADRGVGRS